MTAETCVRDRLKTHPRGTFTVGACLTNVRLLRPARSGIFGRSFHLHSIDYARETIAQSCSLGAALATAPISQTGSWATYQRFTGAESTHPPPAPEPVLSRRPKEPIAPFCA